jgi:chromate transporter
MSERLPAVRDAERIAPLAAAAGASRGQISEVFVAFLLLGFTAFGGPAAHIGYFHREFVERRRWIDERSFADVLALSQFLPGPASSQLGMALGIGRAGLWGALAAWLGFTMPAALAMLAFAYGMALDPGAQNAAWAHGLALSAVAVVAQAVWTLGLKFCRGVAETAVAIFAAALCLAFAAAWCQPLAIALAGLGGVLFWRSTIRPVAAAHPVARYSGAIAAACLVSFAALLIALPLAAAASANRSVVLIDRFYRAGSLVFGGGHVVLPLLQTAIAGPQGVSPERFMAGYGAAQIIPGPLFSFAAYLGASMNASPNGIAGAAICLLAIFLPSFLLVIGALPVWDRLRHLTIAQAALRGINAAVVGLLLAALYKPVFVGAVTAPRDILAVLAALVLLLWAKLPNWAVAGICALAMELASLPGRVG